MEEVPANSQEKITGKKALEVCIPMHRVKLMFSLSENPCGWQFRGDHLAERNILKNKVKSARGLFHPNE